jgi:hypothetical protein
LEENKKKKLEAQPTDWACVAHLSFCFKKLYTEPSYQIVANVATRFQRRFFFRNNQKQELPMLAMFVNGSGRNEQF